MPIYYASGKYKLSICSFSPLKKMFGWRMIQMCKIFFSLEFNGEHKTRTSRPEVFCKKGVLRNVTKFTGKHLCQSLFFNKVADPRPATLFNKRLWHRCFPVNFVKFQRTPFLQNTSCGCF